MTVIQIGSFAIMLKWAILGVSLAIGLIVLKIWLRRTQQLEVNKKIFELLSNSLFIGFFIWKGSLLVLEPQLIMKSPISLLYFTGGTKGLILAIVLSIFYFIYKSNKDKLSIFLIIQSLLVFSFTAFTGFHVISLFVLEGDFVYHILLGVITIVFFTLILVRQSKQSLKGLLYLMIVFSFMNIILSFLFLETENRTVLFSMEQWFFIVIIISSLLYLNKKSIY